MFAKQSRPSKPVLLALVLTLVVLVASEAAGYVLCSFKGIVVDHGWRTMTVKTGGQCATVNVGWKTKYIPNKRPCLGERVAVDFYLDEGYMKATKVVSLTPRAARASCYPPPPPRSTTCRQVPGAPTAEALSDSCPSPKSICSREPPRHVRESLRKPPKGSAGKKPREPKRQPKPKPKPKPKPERERTPPPPPPPPPAVDKDTLTGEVIAASPKSLSIRVVTDGATAEVERVKVGLRTKFKPFRRPAVGEKVKIHYRQEDGDKYGVEVQVIE